MELDILSSFEWEVAVGGYHWVKTDRGAALAPKPHQSGPPRVYWPLSRDHGGLFRTFAALAQTRDEILNFANEYGLLGPPLTQTLMGDRLMDLDARYGEFATRHENISSVVGPLDKVEFLDRGPDRDGRWCWTAQIANMAATLKFDDAGFQALGDSELLVDAKNTIIQIPLDQVLSETTGVRTQWLPDRKRLLLRWGPQSLLGAMWLQLAMSLSGSTAPQECSVCKRPIEISRDPTFGKRSHTRFCSTKCRSKDYRDRRKQARHLAKEGQPDDRIAKKVRSDVETVRGWLKQ